VILLLSASLSYGASKQSALAANATKYRHAESTTRVEQLALNDLYDAGLALSRIKEQAINIYVDTTRTNIDYHRLPELPDFKTISVVHETGDFLPPRRDWLVYSLASMEPLIRLLSNDIIEAAKEIKEVMLPSLPLSKWQSCWSEWTTHVQSLNNRLSTLLPLFEDATQNRELINEQSVAIVKEIDKLECIRSAACEVIVDYQYRQEPVRGD
jgi:hypothetical protein